MRKVLVLATACLLMTSCVIDKREMVSAVDQYNKEFVKVFGETDPNHTWSMVENKKVEVNLTKPSNVKVYVKAGKDYHLAADYQDVSGSQQLSFDAPMGCKDVYVTVDGVPYNSAGSRTAVEEDEWGDVLSVGGENDYRVYTYGEIKGFFDDQEKLPELPERQDNTKKVKMDYIAMAEENKTYTFYPLFWNAYFSHIFGLYYYDANKMKHEIDFYKDKEGDELQYYDSTNGKWENVMDDYVFKYIKNKGFADDDPVLRCKPFTITFPEGTLEFGFYVKVYESNQTEPRAIYYSNPALNAPDYKMSSFGYLVKETEEVKVDNTTEIKYKTYITIEDHNNDDFDYNDFIFVMEGKQSHKENDPVEYLYAVEDLGNTDDFDFNDVVFSVSHISPQTHAIVKPLAAGGTLSADICFNGKSYGEVHAMFAEANEVVNTKVMVNTAAGTTKANMKIASPFIVDNLPADWSHTNSENNFYVAVKKGDNVTELTVPEPGNKAAPQILILPSKWLWPTERTRIDKAYTTFGTWCEKYIDNTWTNTPVKELVVDWVEAPQTNQ